MRKPIIDLDSYFTDIIFNSKYHKYYVNGKEFISCTTYLNKLKYNVFTDELKEIIANKKGWTVEYLNKVWDLKKDLGCLRGDELHFLIESYYKYNINNVPSILIKEESEQFNKFIKENKNLKPAKIEWIVYDTDNEIAGTLDMLFINQDTGNYELYDWKTNKEFNLYSDKYFLKPLSYLEQSDYNIYSLQLSIYKMMIEKVVPIKIDKMFLVHFNKSKSGYDRYEVKYLEKELKLLKLT